MNNEASQRDDAQATPASSSDGPATQSAPRKTKDASTGAVYYYLEGNAIDRTIEVTDWLLVDVDASGAPVGVEWLGDKP